MSDPMNRVNPTRPPWPVRPLAPARKEREPGQRKKGPVPQGPDGDDDERQSTIDEYI